MGTAGNMNLAKLIAGLVGKKFPSKTGTVILLVIWFGVLLFFIVLATMQTVDYYNGDYQIKVFSAKNIEIHE